jgi:hypothetical protein
MINLIPNEEKKVMIKDFYFRLATVIFCAMGFVVLIATISMLPSYFISSGEGYLTKESLTQEQVEELDKMNKQTMVTVNDLDTKLSLIEKAVKSKFLISERIINAVLLNRVSGIKISQISFVNDKTNGKVVNVRGTAPSRERLDIFKRALEDDSLFKKVDLPISNFVKGSNIQFFLNIIPNEN